jgi:hypothetical protein
VETRRNRRVVMLELLREPVVAAYLRIEYIKNLI